MGDYRPGRAKDTAGKELMVYIKKISCRFYIGGYCCHKDAPKSNISCIGKEACEAYLDGKELFSQDNYKTAKELIKARTN